MKRRLAQKGYDDELVSAVMDELKRTGQIDDKKFAKFWVESKMHLNPVGDVVLKHELKIKGLGEVIISSALEDKAKNYDEYEVAMKMARERFERLKKLDRKKASKRLYDFLPRRGFKYETVRRIIENMAELRTNRGIQLDAEDAEDR